ncbi:MAG: CDGSH iron-sulfur domain-containing protein [Methylococcaceae bacterium]|jgi:CDGSH-type Zn-finger protein
MSTPTIAAKQPSVTELEAGSYFWCSCGNSQNGSFCDGSHAGSNFTPQPFLLSEKKTVAICLCKQTKTPPYCDGTHVQL